MLLEFAASVRAVRPVRIAGVLAVAWIVLAVAGCGIKGPLRPATPPAPVATDVGPPLPPADREPPSPIKP